MAINVTDGTAKIISDSPPTDRTRWNLAKLLKHSSYNFWDQCDITKNDKENLCMLPFLSGLAQANAEFYIMPGIDIVSINALYHPLSTKQLPLFLTHSKDALAAVKQLVEPIPLQDNQFDTYLPEDMPHLFFQTATGKVGLLAVNKRKQQCTVMTISDFASATLTGFKPLEVKAKKIDQQYSDATDTFVNVYPEEPTSEELPGLLSDIKKLHRDFPTDPVKSFYTKIISLVEKETAAINQKLAQAQRAGMICAQVDAYDQLDKLKTITREQGEAKYALLRDYSEVNIGAYQEFYASPSNKSKVLQWSLVHHKWRDNISLIKKGAYFVTDLPNAKSVTSTLKLEDDSGKMTAELANRFAEYMSQQIGATCTIYDPANDSNSSTTRTMKLKLIMRDLKSTIADNAIRDEREKQDAKKNAVRPRFENFRNSLSNG